VARRVAREHLAANAAVGLDELRRKLAHGQERDRAVAEAVDEELAAERSKTGYERFTKLWELSLQENRRHAHLTIRYEDLTRDFEAVCGQIWAAVPCTTDYAPLKRWVVPTEKQGQLRQRSKSLDSRLRSVADRIRFSYGKLRLRLASLFR